MEFVPFIFSDLYYFIIKNKPEFEIYELYFTYFNLKFYKMLCNKRTKLFFYTVEYRT